jgi:hypothetical protein
LEAQTWFVRSALKYNRAWIEVLFDSLEECLFRVGVDDQLTLCLNVLHLSCKAPSALFALKLQKYQTVALFAKFMNQELPKPPGLSELLQYMDDVDLNAGKTRAQALTTLIQEAPNNVEYSSAVHAKDIFDSMVGFYVDICPFKGRLRRAILGKCGRKGNRTAANLHLFNSILQGIKRGCEAAPEEVVNSSKVDQMNILSKEKGVSWSILGEIDDCCKRLSRRFRPKKAFKLTEVSTSSCFTYTRLSGGAREAVKEELGMTSEISDPLCSMNELGELRGASLRSTDRSEIMDRLSRELYGRTHEVKLTESVQRILDTTDPDAGRSPLESMGPLIGPRSLVVYPTAGPPEFDVRDPSREGETADPSLGQRMGVEAKVEAVLEPLKVRLITKSDALRQWVSKWFQGEMHSWLKTKKQFRLIGEPLDMSHLYWLYEQTCKVLPAEHRETWLWESGDYAAATDRLSLDATKTAFEWLLLRLPPSENWIIPLLRDILYEQWISADLKSEEPLNRSTLRYLQKNGQLMGSVLSFPILCIINFACFWSALEEYLGRRCRFCDVPCLINGDDFLALMPPGLRRLWVLRVKGVGFEFSLGKNYTDRKFFLINSTLFKFDWSRTTIAEVKYLNTGLLTGQAKVSGRAVARLAPLGAIYNSVVGGAAQPARAARRFIHYHRDQIRELTQGGTYNLYLPLSRGGLGFTAFVPPGAYATAYQCRYAHFIEKVYKSVERRSPEIPGLTWTLKAKDALPAMRLKSVSRLMTRFVVVPEIGPLPPGVTLEPGPESRQPLLMGFKTNDDPDALRYFRPKDKFLKLFRRSTNKRLLVRDGLLQPIRIGVVYDSPAYDGFLRDAASDGTESPEGGLDGEA